MNIGILCRSTEHFQQTIDYMIANKCLKENTIVKRSMYELCTYKAIYRPIYLGQEESRGYRFDLVIPEVSMPRIAEHKIFHDMRG